MNTDLKSWACALVAVLVAASSGSASALAPAARVVAFPPGLVNISPDHGRTFVASFYHGDIRISGPASVARGPDAPPTSRSASMDPDFRWFPRRMFDAFEGLHFETFDPHTGDYALYARAGLWTVHDRLTP